MTRFTKAPRIKKNSFEYAAWADHQLIIGIDEVGRGCLAGPVVTCALALKVGSKHPLLKDSKVLTPENREKIYFFVSIAI